MNFPQLKNDNMIRAAYGKPVDYVPCWIMRQAGRYLPEFRELRSKHSFFEICQTPELACEATLMPIRRFDLDAAIIFSDILVIPQALGMNVKMVEAIGPVLDAFNTPDDMKTKIDRSVNINEKLDYVYKAITLTRHKLEGKVPLFGFSGAPFTLLSYMVEGKGSKTMSKVKKWLYLYPEACHELLQFLSDKIIDYLIGQVHAGAQMLQIFESHAGVLGPKTFDEFCLPYISKISKKVREAIKKFDSNLRVPITIFAKDSHYVFDKLCDPDVSGYDVVSLDWTIDPKLARKTSNGRVTLQGNLDPCALYSPADKLDHLISDMIENFGTTQYIANLGHGIYPDMDPQSVQTFVSSVHSHSKRIMQSN